MAKLGADFNANSPTDADFVRHPSRAALPAQIRHVRERLKEFFTELLDLEGGDFKNNVIPGTSLVDHPDKPESGSRPYTSVTVDSRGFVTAGTKDPVYTAARHFRAFFSYHGAQIETAGGIETYGAPAPQWLPANTILWQPGLNIVQPTAYEYRFVVPEKVTRLSATLQSGGWREGNAPTDGRRVRRTATFPVEPGNVFRIWVGASDSPSAVYLENGTRYITSQGYFLNVSTPTAGFNELGVAQQWTQGPLRPYGQNGVVGSPEGIPGFVLFEWYA